jgi:hypothetical protein
MEEAKRIAREIIGVYLFWIMAHWISSQLYVSWCVGEGLYDILMSPFIAPLPQCVCLRWMMYNGGRMIEVMWIMVGKWTIERMILYNVYKNET